MITPTWTGLARMTDEGTTVDGPFGPWDPSRHDVAKVLVIDATGDPVGWVRLKGPDPAEAQIDDAIRGLLEQVPNTAGKVSPRRQMTVPSDVSSAVEPRPSAEIAICTHERPVALARCLEALHRSDEGLPVLVVDNAPRSGATAAVVDRLAAEGLQVRRVMEPRVGVARARNRALRASAADLLVFTDDDVIPDRHWVTRTLAGFTRSSDVALVTGLVPAAELETDTQHYFDDRLAWSSALAPEVYSLSRRDQYDFPFPYSAGHFGTGANMAMRRQVVLDLGGFDERLGTGRRSRGGEDLDLFVRVLRAGYELAYEPASIAWHVHRREVEDLERQVFGYGSGLTAYLTAVLLQPNRRDFIGSLGFAVRRLFRAMATESGEGNPSRLLTRELAGMAWGPVAFALDAVDDRHRRGRGRDEAHTPLTPTEVAA